MTDVCIRGVVETIHSSPTQAVLYLSGGASQAAGTWVVNVSAWSHKYCIGSCGKIVIISNQSYFHKKAELFPGSAFVIGAETAARLINPKYYGGEYGRMLDILSGCKNMGCLFLVGGRNADGVFKVLDDLDIPEQLNDMFISIPAEQFRTDISSTEIRKNLGML